jgi:hypothetical protein
MKKGLEEQERAFVSELTRLAPRLQTVQTLAQDFLEMMRKRVERVPSASGVRSEKIHGKRVTQVKPHHRKDTNHQP